MCCSSSDTSGFYFKQIYPLHVPLCIPTLAPHSPDSQLHDTGAQLHPCARESPILLKLALPTRSGCILTQTPSLVALAPCRSNRVALAGRGLLGISQTLRLGNPDPRCRKATWNELRGGRLSVLSEMDELGATTVARHPVVGPHFLRTSLFLSALHNDLLQRTPCLYSSI